LTDEEEKIVFNEQFAHGNKWADIAKLLHGRTDNIVKNHFYSTLRRQLRKTLRKVLNNQEAEPEEVNVDYLRKVMKDYNVDYTDIDNPNVRNMMKRLNGQEDKVKSVPKKRTTRKYELYLALINQ
jgi:hypothetical protein